MTTAEIKNEIFESEDFVISELKKVQILYGLKKEIRYAQTRTNESDTESVAEHIYGMHCLMDYFQTLEDIEGNWDQAKIRTMILYHDIDEIETGDVVGYLKSETDRLNERSAAKLVILKLPETIQTRIKVALDEYEQQETIESKFVKALDKIEPVFQLYNEEGRAIIAKLKTTKEQHDRIKFPYIQNFPVILRFAEVMTETFAKEGYYSAKS